MEWRDVYNAACRELRRIEVESGKGDGYRAAILKLNELEDLRCHDCQGFGYNNIEGGHFADAKDSPFSERCGLCNGSGFELDLGLIAERARDRMT